MMKRHILPFLLLLLLAFPARADVLTGVVLDDQGNPIVGAFIEVQGLGLFMTSATGAFSITLLRGTYNIQIFEDQNGFAPVILANVIVNGTKNVGSIMMNDGFMVSGTVLQPGGAAIVNGDIDVFDVETGIKLDTPNDKTDVLGQFTIVLPARQLRIRAEPVVGQIIVAQSFTTTIAANTTLPTFTLPAGHLLTGNVRNAQTNLPLSAVDLDVDDLTSGMRIETPSDSTDALGNFSVIVPSGTFRVSFGAAAGQAFIGKRVDYVPVTGATAMGTITLTPGIFINGTVKDPSGHPVVNADIDVRTLAGDAILYTPNDSTGPAGTFGVVVPAGMHRVVIQADASTNLVSTTTLTQNFVTTTTLPGITLANGIALSGTISAFGGIPQSDVRVIVKNSTTGAKIETPNNATDAAGFYKVIVPAGTYDLDLRTRKASIVRDMVDAGVVVTAPTVRNVAMALVPMLVYLDDPAFPAAQVVLPGSPQFFATIAIWNPTGVTSGVFLDAEWEDPYGNIITMLLNSAVVLGAQQYVYQPFLAIPLPAVAPANIGLPHKFRLVLKDPLDGSTVDIDEFEIFPL